ncbi:N-acetylneuraminate synthase family protein [Pseudomonadales bacterium]|nr:N-acetylneuraminate synthase family protein [Pseudomonadales bacterium]
MPNFKIGKKLVGDDQPVFIIAEGGDAHLGCMVRAKEMVRLAKLAGADAIKFQHHLPYEEMLQESPTSDNMTEPLYDFLVKNALSLDQHIELKGYCDEVQIQYMCTPFSYKAAEELNRENLLDVIKIGSGEMTDIPSLLKMAKFGKPMIVSTGMCTFDEIEDTYSSLIDAGAQLALTNCVSEYPPVYEDINLHVINRMQEKFGSAVIGHSDHTPSLYTCFGAVMLGAKIVEKHVIINKLTPGPDQAVSIDFNELRQLVDGIRILEAASGDIKEIHERESDIRAWAFRSIVSCCTITKGTTITEDMIWSKRPGTGIPAKLMGEIIGRVAAKDISENVLLDWSDLV